MTAKREEETPGAWGLSGRCSLVLQLLQVAAGALFSFLPSSFISLTHFAMFSDIYSSR